MVNLFAGMILGVVTSLVAWWLGASGLAPRIAFGRHVSKLPLSSEGKTYRYRLKFAARQRRWLPSRTVDGEVTIELRIRGLFPDFPHNLISIPIPVRHSRIHVFVTTQIVLLRLWAIDPADAELLPPDVAEAVANRSITLERLLRLGSKATLKITVSAADAVMRARGVETAEYDLQSIREGRFQINGLDVVEAGHVNA